MQAIVKPDTRPLAVTYDRAYTAVNAPNVEHTAQVKMVQPFQPQSRYPQGQPPVRYPNVTTTPGFLNNPAEDDMDARNVAERMADAYDPDDPMPFQTDSFAVYGTHFQTATSSKPSEVVSSNTNKLFGTTNSFPLTAWE